MCEENPKEKVCEKIQVDPSVLEVYISDICERAFYKGMIIGTMYGMFVALILGSQLREK